MSATHEVEFARSPSVRARPRPPRPLFSSRQHAWDGIFVEVYRADDINCIAAHPEHVISLQFKGFGDFLKHDAAHGAREGIRFLNAVDITPAGAPRHWRYDEEAEVLMLHIAPALVESVADEENRQPAGRIELVIQRGIRDATIERIAVRFLEELMVGGFADRTCVQLLANLLVIHLLRHYSTISETADRASSKLARHKLRRATDYINKNLRDDLSLEKISKALCMSPCHFAHQFKQTTGHTPHRYVIGCRMEKAKSLLRETKLSVSEIAQMVGYTSQGYFSTVFRQSIGRSPLRYRNDA
jgi:AraC family transcriptional regulator